MSFAFTTPIVALTVRCNSTMEVWKVLENLFPSISNSHVMNLKGELHSIGKDIDSSDIYLKKIKVFRDKLMIVGVFLPAFLIQLHQKVISLSIMIETILLGLMLSYEVFDFFQFCLMKNCFILQLRGFQRNIVPLR